MPEGSPVNTGEPRPWPGIALARARVLEIQSKLHRWAAADPGRRFDDLFNLVADPAFLLVAWDRVRFNKGARSAGVDGQTAYYIETERGELAFLSDVREGLRSRTFRPLPVKERMIPKANGKRRRLGIPTITDRVVQASLKLVLEPIFEADFLPCSYGFRPNRNAHDAVAEIRHFASRSYEWAVEGDIEACFDTIEHTPLMERVRHRIGDKRVLALVKAFLKAGILAQDGQLRDNVTGTPQGGILSPLLANIALSVLDEHFTGQWTGWTKHQRMARRRDGRGVWRLIRYADDFVIAVSGTRASAEALREETARVLAPMGMRLSMAKTRITHIDEGFDFLGWRIQRHHKKGTADQHYVYNYPAKKAVLAFTRKIKTLTCRKSQNLSLEALLHRLNPVVRGWTQYFRNGVSSATFRYLRAVLWKRVTAWIRGKHARITWKELRRKYCAGGWWPTVGEAILYHPERTSIRWYTYRGARIPSPWPVTAAV